MKITPFWRKQKDLGLCGCYCIMELRIHVTNKASCGSVVKHKMPFYFDLIAFHQNVLIANLTGNYLPSSRKIKKLLDRDIKG